MRTAFIQTLTELAARDRNMTLVVGDLGFGVVQDFARRFPAQFVNAGVAEQNMTAVAAGLALCGKSVYTYSIANFPTLRCLEHIRNDVCYHDVNVKIVAVGGGFAYGALGMTHHATEDLGILRTLPNLRVIAPGDPVETAALVRELERLPGPAYIRLGRAGEPTVHNESTSIKLGEAAEVRPGNDLTLITTGGMLATAAAASDRLKERGCRVRVLSMHTLKPLDDGAVLRAAAETGGILTLEEHSVIGGLGGAVAEVLAESDRGRARFRRLGLPSRFTQAVGDQQYLRGVHGLSVEAVVEAVTGELESAGSPAEPTVMTKRANENDRGIAA